MRRGRGLAAALLGLLAGGTLLGGPAQAQVVVPTESAGEGGGGAAAAVETELAGIAGRAITSGMHVFYNPQGVLPIAAPVDFGSPDALATISAGPTTLARASVADPGDLLANPGALLGAASPDYEPGTIPEYPYRVTATSGFGEPRAESNPAPGLNATVEAQPDRSRARAITPAALAPGVAGVGSMASESTTTIETSAASVRARTEISTFNLLNVLKIESIVTDVTASSDGTETKLEGGTTITGATVMDQPVTIDAEGVRAEEGAEEPALPLGALTKPLREDPNALLERVGIRVTAAGPIEEKGGTSGQRSTTGLRIDLEFSERTYPQLASLLDALPVIESPIPDAPSPADAIELIKARNLVAIDLGRAQVSLTAKKAIPIDEAAFASDSAFGAGGNDFGSISTGLGGSPTVGSVARTPGAAPRAAAIGDPTPVASVGAGIGALALLALLAQPLLGGRIARAATALLGGTEDDFCLREER